MSLNTLRWLTVVVPLVFLVAVDYVRHFVYPELLHPFSGYLIVLSFVTFAVLLFSFTVFGVIARMQKQILSQNHKLAEMSEISQRQASKLRALHEAGLALASDLEPEAVLQRGVDLARELVGARYGALAVLGDGNIAYFLTSGLSAEDRARLGELPTGRGLLGAVIAERRTIRIDNMPHDHRAIGNPPHHPAMTTFLGVPIVAKGRVLGSLYLTDKNGPNGVVPFTADDEEALRLFAAQAAAALENARLHSKIESLAATAERERIARELHDSLAQALGYIIVRAQAAEADLMTNCIDGVREGLDRMRTVADAAYADVREAILGLRSRIGTDRDLAQSLADYLERYRLQSGIKADLEILDGADRLCLAPAAEVQLLRIIQEALANVRKHARAQTTKVRLEQVDLPHVGVVLRTTVEDNGQGFDAAGVAAQLGRYGLATMHERAEDAGGRLRIETALGAGTRVIVELPALGFPVPLGKERIASIGGSE